MVPVYLIEVAQAGQISKSCAPSAIGQIPASGHDFNRIRMSDQWCCQKSPQANRRSGQGIDEGRRDVFRGDLVLNRIAVALRVESFTL